MCLTQLRKLAMAREKGRSFKGFPAAKRKQLEQLDQEIVSKKTKSTQDKYIKMKSDGLKFLKTNLQSLYFTVASYMNLIEAKTFVIRKLELVKTLGTFLRTDNGYEVTAPEGFVAIKSGNALKLVDRLEFSRANFTAAKDWENG